LCMALRWFFFLGLCRVLPVLGQDAAALYKEADRLFLAGKYAECLSRRLQAVQLAEKSGRCPDLAIGFFQVGRAYYYLHKPAEARQWLQASLSKARSCGIDSLVFITHRSLGALFVESKQVDSALWHLNLARNMYHPSILPLERATLLSILFELEIRQLKNPVLARATLDSARKYYAQKEDSIPFAFYLIKEGIYYLETGDFPKAARFFRRSAAVYQKAGSTDGRMYALHSLSKALSEGGQLEEAIAVLRQLSAIKDTVFQAQTARDLARYQVQYQTQKKEIENLELRNRNDRIRMGFGLGLGGMVLLGGIGFLVREGAHRRRLLRQKQEEQRIRFTEVVEAQELERTRIARDLHDGLGHLMAAIKLNASALQLGDERNLRILDNALSIIDQASAEVRQISHRLMPQSLSDLGLRASLNDLAHRINRGGALQVELALEPDTGLDSGTEVALYRVVQEVLNNALKHAGATRFDIRMHRAGGKLQLELEDNGCGFDPLQVSAEGGLGLKNIRSRVELTGGTWHLESHPGKGTKIVVQIPLQKPTSDGNPTT
jgi:two-component system NarL family sensor kinase